MDRFHQPSHRGPKAQQKAEKCISTWRKARRDERPNLEKVSNVSLLKGLASRTAVLADRPLGMPGDSEEAVWVEYFRGVKTTWRVCFTAKNFTLTQLLQSQNEWLQLRQALVTATRYGLQKSLIRERGEFRAPVSKIVVEAVRLLSEDPKEDSGATFATNVFLECAAESEEAEALVRKAMKSSGLKADFAEVLTGCLSQLERGTSISADSVVVCQELPKEIELRGGHGEQLFVAAVPDCSRAANHGLCEGFELLAMVFLSPLGEKKSIQDKALQALRSDQVLSKLAPVSVRLCFRSPFAKLPRFSSKQLADRMGFGKIRELHFHRLVENLKYNWRPLHLEKRHELRQLERACDADDSGRAMLVENIQWGSRELQRDSMLRLNSRADFLLMSELPELPLPEKLEIGRPRHARKLRPKGLREALREAGIYWLREPEEEMLLEVLQQERFAGDESESSESWEEALADAFVIDSAGHFSKIGSGTLRTHHVFHVTKKIKETLRCKAEAKGGLLAASISRSEFASILNAGSIMWLTREQMDVIFSVIGGQDAEAGISLSDWVSRFSWDPMQAATEVQRVLDVWARRFAEGRAVPYFRGWSVQNQGRAAYYPPPRPRSLHFWDFHMVLTDMGVHWLSLEQQRLLFQSLDANRNGRVEVEELQVFADKRVEVEMKRVEQMASAGEDDSDVEEVPDARGQAEAAAEVEGEEGEEAESEEAVEAEAEVADESRDPDSPATKYTASEFYDEASDAPEEHREVPKESEGSPEMQQSLQLSEAQSGDYSGSLSQSASPDSPASGYPDSFESP
ncbi:unnamed protein product [Symbiodinium sp. CCMP2456]|nr:unnamed protein product [Symbiodinium sp. CCMP2456]